MNSQRKNSDLKLIRTLIESQPYQRLDILNENLDLLDNRLQQTIQELDQELTGYGDIKTANFLKEIAAEILCQQVLTAITSEDAEQKIAQLLSQYLAIITHNGFYNYLRTFISFILQQENWSNLNIAVLSIIDLFIYQLPDIINNCLSKPDEQINAQLINTEINIAVYESILTVFVQEVDPEIWAGFSNDLGNAYFNRLKGKSDDNLEQAIACYHQALQVLNPNDYLKKWANTSNNLAAVYLKRKLDTPESNIQTAIRHCQVVLAEINPLDFPFEWGDAQSHLGTAYLNSKNPEKAIFHYQNVLQAFTKKAYPDDWARINSNLGDIFLNLDRFTEAIIHYQNALQVFTEENNPEQWARTNLNLGFAYYKNSEFSVENVQKIKKYSENALKIFNLYPEVYAQAIIFAQNNLSVIQSLNWSNNPEDNTEKSIKDLEGILKTLTKESSPQDWANTHLNLGNIYLFRNQGDRADNLEKAKEHYQQSLEIFNASYCPQEWALSQYGLGMVFRNRVLGDRERDLELAIYHFNQALTIQTITNFSKDYATTQHNLAKTYRQRISGNKSENLGLAIEHFSNALLVRTRDKYPQSWAVTQHQIGFVYFDRYYYEQKLEDLAKAIECWESELEVLKKEQFPDDTGRAEGALAQALLKLYLKVGRSKNWEKALIHVNNHLDIFKKEISPRDYIEGLDIKSKVYLAARRWQEAYENLKEAIDCIEKLRHITVAGDEAKQKLAEKHYAQYVQMIKVCLELNNYTTALEYVERSKARNLVELLANKDIYPKFDLYHNSEIYETHCQELEQLRRQIPAIQRNLAELERDIQKFEDKGHKDLEQKQAELAQKRQQLTQKQPELNQLQKNLNKLIAEINKIDSRFAFTQEVQSIPFSDIQSLTDENTAIVEWYITGSQILTFIVTCHHPHPIVVPFENITALANWDKEYRDSYQNKKNQWINNLADRLQNLAEILHIDDIISRIDQCFSESDAKCNRLILIPHRYLHLFPLHALPLADGKLLFECFSKGMGYAPSCQLLKQAKDQEQNRPDFNRLFAIQNPTRQPADPLLGSQIEIEKIRQHFDLDQSVILKEAEATETNLYQRMEQMRSSHCIHFSCHGKFYPQSPLKSALRLADPEGKLGEEANLTLGEVFEKLYLNQCRLVTFSACESGMTDPNSISDEYIGLPSGFLYAGSLSVVSTLWSVDPIATTLLMVKFYHNLKRLPEIKKGDVAIALNKAQKWLRTLTHKKWARIQNHPQFQKLVDEAFVNSPKRDYNRFKDSLFESLLTDRQPLPFANPYYWSAFVAIGI